jgi:hypothetical protein
MRPQLVREDGRGDDVAVDVSAYKPHVPDGDYSAILIGHDTAFIFRTAKAILRFRIATPGPQCGIELFKAYRVWKLRSKPGRGGQIALRPTNELFVDLVRLLQIKQRPDRISLRDLQGIVWRITTRTVTKDYQQRPIPDFLQYSVIDRIIEAETGP